MKRKQAKKPSLIAEVNKKLDLILKQQEVLLSTQKATLKEEAKIEQEEKKIEKEETEEKGEEITELQQLKVLEEQIQEEVKNNPLRKITYRDFTKGMIGAFVGIVAHFSFLEGLDVAENFTMIRATLLYVISFIIGMMFLYFAGFRRVGDKMMLKFIPLRIVVIYASALLVVLIVLSVFGMITFQSNFDEVYKTVSAISILAILGACTADLIGKEH